jgi:predicted RNase H-like HicB family nuclease
MADVAELQHTIKAYVRRGEKYYVAECLGISVVTQGKTLDETIANLEEAVALHLEGES